MLSSPASCSAFFHQRLVTGTFTPAALGALHSCFVHQIVGCVSYEIHDIDRSGREV